MKKTYYEAASKALQQMPDGLFMTVKEGDQVNTMTLGWGSVSFMWNKPVFVAMVRYSRYTYEQLLKSKEFTISVPATGEMRNQLSICGSRSGRNSDKVIEAGLKLAPGKTVATPVIKDCPLHIECKVVYRQVMEPAALDAEIDEAYYTNRNYHVMFYGEIVDSYEI